MSRTLSRRALTTVLAGTASVYFATLPESDSALAQGEATPVPSGGERSVLGEVSTPAWRFAVSQIQDPYRGQISAPDSAPPNLRFVGAEVLITNDSDQPFEFHINEIRLRDVDGFQYAAGQVFGTEPRLVAQNLPDGERTRGWLWFMVPAGSSLLELAFEAPPPILRIPLS